MRLIKLLHATLSPPPVPARRYTYFINLTLQGPNDPFHCEACTHILLRGVTARGLTGAGAPCLDWDACPVQETIKMNQCKGVWLEDLGECRDGCGGGPWQRQRQLQWRAAQGMVDCPVHGRLPCSCSGKLWPCPCEPAADVSGANDNAFDCVACQVGTAVWACASDAAPPFLLLLLTKQSSLPSVLGTAAAVRPHPEQPLLVHRLGRVCERRLG